jgi:RNA polymerase sigma-70 factor (ECF subfamily)
LDDSNAGPDSPPDGDGTSRAGSGGPTDAANDGAIGVDVSEWVTTHWDATYKLLYRLTVNRHDAEDLTQETFLRAIERQASFKSGTNLRAWLLRIATNAFLDRQRRKKIMKIAPLPEEISEDAPGPGQGLDDLERHASVEAAIASLPEVQRVIFVLRGQSELSFRDIGHAIGMTEETARWHMMQARRQLLGKLDGILG